ncbi:Elongation factor Ts [Methylacidimicrobium sp. AP8]|uniref:translation elongation factor Ts n=1 Tax=Methylacidimicrobium sp. AP8 TaxID=2730359 RepID=UPI0018BFAA42|nr:translation elongation factor Ts [Methylacidimicrobium sp. AP8]CAB4244219.1 Elongation factor Ts [Methylacidimicrobium sp. AP8]
MKEPIGVELIKELREKTGAGIMDCKRAIEKSGGELEAAEKWLWKQGIAKAQKKSARETPEGVIASYIHVGEKVGVLVEVNCETDFVARNSAFRDLVKDITLQIAAANPRYVSRDQVPEAEIERVRREIAAENAGKPAAILEKIVTGRLEKYFATHCLLEQAFIKDQNATVRDVLAAKIGQIGENIVVRRFVRYQLGEPLS